MSIDKSLRQHYAIQGGGPNYLGKQKMVKAPKKWKSSPDHEPAELAYITKKEKDILLDLNIYGSLKNGKPNRGPSGIISLQGDMGGYGGTGGGGGNAGDRGGGPHQDWSAPAPAPAPSPSPHRDPTPTRAPDFVTGGPKTSPSTSPSKGDAPGREFAIATQNITPTYDDYNYPGIDTSSPSTTIGPSLHGDTSEQKEADELNRQKELRDIIKQGQEEKYGPTADPTKFGETISKLDVAMSKNEGDRTIDDKLAIEEWENEQDWDKVQDLADKGHSSDDIQKAMDKGLLMKEDSIRRQGLIERGLAAVMPKTKLESSLLSNLKSKLDPKSMIGNVAKNFALKKLGLGWLNPVMGLASLFGFDPMKKAQAAFAKKPIDMSAFNKLGLYADRQPTDTTKYARVGEGTIGDKIVSGEVDLNKLISGGDLSDIKGQQAKLVGLALAQKRVLEKKKGMSDLGGPKFTPTDQRMLDKLEKMDKEEKVYSKPILTAAYGGRIDKPLIGRNRYI